MAAPQFKVNAHRFDPYKNFKFRVKFVDKPDPVAGVSKVSSLKRTTEVVKHREGNDPSSSRKSPGNTEFEAITLERGVTHDEEFELWANRVWNYGAGATAETSLSDFRRDLRIERRSRLKIDGGLATGVLTRATRLGVVIDSCPGTERAWKEHTEPYLKAKGITVASTAQIGCANGAGDAGAEAGRVGNVILQFRADGVDTIMANAVSEGPGVLIFANAAEAQGWRPKYVVTSLANAAVLQGQIPNNQAANVHGYGWLPSQDVSPAGWPANPPAAERCLSLVKAKGVQLQAAADFAYAFNACEALFLYERALEATGNRTDGPAIAAAVQALGGDYSGVMTLEGRLAFSRTQRDGPALARYFAWDGGCSCFTYRSTTVPIA